MSRPAERGPSFRRSIPRRNAAGSTDTGVKEPSRRTDTSCNVLIFGQAGAGKSSLVNLIARKEIAQTSPNTRGCTTETNTYDILIQNESLKVKLFDTPGLDQDSESAVPDEKARLLLENLIRTLTEQGGIQLIMYCVRGATRAATQALCGHYDFIRSKVEKLVPIVLVVTGLDCREPEMEDWWRVNETYISNLGMNFAGHACVTTANAKSQLGERRNQSYHTVCNLIKQTSTSATRSNTHKNVILFGQAGSGKSSLINLMAGKDEADTSPDMKPHRAISSAEYDIEFDGESYKVFETIGLEEPQLGLPQYLETVRSACELIQNLESQGGIDLLLFCMRAGRLTATLQSNYRLFHEFLCDKQVPIVIAITHLEEEEGRLNAWWERNEEVFLEQDVRVDGHACVVAADRHDKYPLQYKESRVKIRNLVKKFTVERKSTLSRGDHFVRFMLKLKNLLLPGGVNRKHIVSYLTTRCGVPRDAAREVAEMIKKSK